MLQPGLSPGWSASAIGEQFVFLLVNKLTPIKNPIIPEEKMKSRSILFTLCIVVVTVVLAACGGAAAATEAPAYAEQYEMATQPPVMEAPAMPGEFSAPESVLKA